MTQSNDLRKQDYIAYFVNNDFRKEAIMLFSFCKKVDWAENGLGIVSWDYKKKRKCSACSLSEAYSKMNKLQRLSSSTSRTVGIGDIICAEDTPWIITGNGFERVPLLLWKRIEKK